MLEDLKTQMDRVRFLSFNHFHVAQLIAQHSAIIDAIASGSTAQAVQHMRKHLREILNSLPMITHEHPEFFNLANDEFAKTSTVVKIGKI